MKPITNQFSVSLGTKTDLRDRLNAIGTETGARDWAELLYKLVDAYDGKIVSAPTPAPKAPTPPAFTPVHPQAPAKPEPTPPAGPNVFTAKFSDKDRPTLDRIEEYFFREHGTENPTVILRHCFRMIENQLDGKKHLIELPTPLNDRFNTMLAKGKKQGEYKDPSDLMSRIVRYGFQFRNSF